jgi:hypothetical protein
MQVRRDRGDSTALTALPYVSQESSNWMFAMCGHGPMHAVRDQRPLVVGGGRAELYGVSTRIVGVVFMCFP